MEMNVVLETFEGPMALLYHLIEKNEIDIYDIPMAVIADQFMVYLDKFPADMESMSSFLIMAASLLEIKSKMLLPVVKEKAAEESDPREALVRRLMEYKRFKEITDFFKVREGSSSNVIFKEPDKDVLELFKKPKAELRDVLEGVTMDQLYSVFQDVLRRKELKTDKVRSSFNSVSREIFTVDDKIEFLGGLLKTRKQFRFSEAFEGIAFKIEKIVTFLALLELIRMKEVKISQSSLFDDIMIKAY